jgi:hypothetical protein
MEDDFETVRDVVKSMVGAAHELVLARSGCNHAFSDSFRMIADEASSQI